MPIILYDDEDNAEEDFSCWISRSTVFLMCVEFLASYLIFFHSDWDNNKNNNYYVFLLHQNTTTTAAAAAFS